MDNDIEAETDTGCDSVTQTHSNTKMLNLKLYTISRWMNL